MKNGTCECNLVIYGIIRCLESGMDNRSRSCAGQTRSQQGAHHIALPIGKLNQVSPTQMALCVSWASEHHNGDLKPWFIALLAQNSYKQLATMFETILLIF